jgi:hypothetical protein
MSIHEMVLPETKPETEWIRGRARQKGERDVFSLRLAGAALRKRCARGRTTAHAAGFHRVAFSRGTGVHVLRAGDVPTHTGLPGFALEVGALFVRAKR